MTTQNITASTPIISNEVLKVNDIKLTNKVAHSNDLIKTFSKLDKTPLKIFEIAVSCIDVNNPPKDNIVYLDKQQLFNCFQAEDTKRYTRFKEHLKKLMLNVIDISNDKNEKLVVPIPFTEWSLSDHNNLIKIKFSEEIMPYLIELKQNFTQYQLKETLTLNSKHSVIIFKWLMMNYKQKNYNYNKQQPIIKISDFRELTNTINEYKRDFNELERFVIQKSIQEINKKTSLSVTYKKIKKGRNIDNIQFFISEKNKQTTTVENSQTTLDEFIEEEVTLEDLLQEINSLFSDENYQATDLDIMTLKFFVSQYGATKTRKAFVKCHVLGKLDEQNKVDLKVVEDYLQHDKVEI